MAYGFSRQFLHGMFVELQVDYVFLDELDLIDRYDYVTRSPKMAFAQHNMCDLISGRIHQQFIYPANATIDGIHMRSFANSLLTWWQRFTVGLVGLLPIQSQL